MSQIYIEPTGNHGGEFEVLDLELCPPPVQVMPPVNQRSLPLLVTVLGNTLLGALLLAGLLLMPAMLAGLAAGY